MLTGVCHANVVCRRCVCWNVSRVFDMSIAFLRFRASGFTASLLGRDHAWQPGNFFRFICTHRRGRIQATKKSSNHTQDPRIKMCPPKILVFNVLLQDRTYLYAQTTNYHTLLRALFNCALVLDCLLSAIQQDGTMSGRVKTILVLQ